MPAYFATPLSSVTALSAGVAAKVPATAQGSRMMLKLYNEHDTVTAYYGGSTVSSSNGIPIPPGGESEWIPCSGDIWCICASAANIRALEGA